MRRSPVARPGSREGALIRPIAAAAAMAILLGVGGVAPAGPGVADGATEPESCLGRSATIVVNSHAIYLSLAVRQDKRGGGYCHLCGDDTVHAVAAPSRISSPSPEMILPQCLQTIGR